MSERTTLSEVAEAAGVHTSTASRALNVETRSVVNPQTVTRVLKAAKKLGYTPNPMARGLRTNRTMTVGIVIPDIGNPLFALIIAGAEERLGADGYSLLVANANRDDQTSIASIVNTLIDRRVDGLILATSARSDALATDLARRKIPAVLVNRMADGSPLPSIVGDDHAGIGLAVQHLADLGHRRIGHVAGPLNLSTGMSRYQAFLTWTKSVGIDLDSSAVEEAESYQIEPGVKSAAALLERCPELTALVCANDLLALGAYRAIRQLGLEVAVDVSVTGYNDMPLLDLMQPPLTSVRVPYREMGAESAAMLLSMLQSDGDPVTPVSIRLVPALADRGSTQPPPV